MSSPVDYKALARSLRDIGRDHAHGGAESTAADYFDAARALDALRVERDALRAERDTARRAAKELSTIAGELSEERNALREERDALRDRLNRVYREINS